MNREELAARLEQIGGCGNANCIVYEPPGQHTNGGCKCNRDPMRMSQTVWAYKQALAGSTSREDALRAEVEALREAVTEELEMYKKGYESSMKIIKSIFPDKFPGTYFITGEAGEKVENNLPETLLVCPAHGVDWFQLYKRTDKTHGPEY